MNTKAFRSKILDLAIHGKLLSEKEAAECRKGETATELLEKIRKEKEDKIAKGELKADKKSSFVFVGDDRRHYEKVFTYGKPADGTERCVEDEIPFEVPDGWAWCRLGELVSILGDGLHGTPIYNSNGNYYFVNGNNLSNGKIIIKSDTKKVDEKEFLKYKKNLNKSTILVSINGTLGNVAFYNNEKIILGKSACYFNLCNTELKEFVFSILKTTHFLKYATNNATGSTIKNVSLESMRNFLIPLPPLSEQKAIVAKIEEIFSQIDILENNKNDLQTTIKHAKSKILDLAIHGKLVPQDPNDEPASKLLDRIHSNCKFDEGKQGKRSEKILHNGRYEKLEEPFDIPDNWVWCEFKKICWLNDGVKSTEELINLDAKFLRGKSPGNKLTSGRKVFKNDKLILVDGENSGEVFTAPIDGYLGSTFKKLCFSEIEFEEYANIFLDCHKEEFRNNKTGSAIPHLNKKLFSEIPFPLPPLAEQKRIVEKIESLFSILDKITGNLS